MTGSKCREDFWYRSTINQKNIREPNRKQPRDLNRYITKELIQMTNKYEQVLKLKSYKANAN